MCIEYRWSDKDIKNWLEQQPETITAYKLVRIKKNKMYSPFQRNRIKENNRISKLSNRMKDRKNRVDVLDNEKHSYTKNYQAYYHCFMDEKEANRLYRASGEHIIRCEIPKIDITDIGEQWGRVVIVSKSFSVPDYKNILKENKKSNK